LSEWSKARVNIDYHVVFDNNYYSVPYNLVQQVVEIRSMPTTVEIFHKGKRVASHLRNRGHNNSITLTEHRPKSHQEHLAWPPSRILSWAGTIGPNAARVVERIMEDQPHPEMGYRACLGIIRLAKKYSNQRLEGAAMRGLLTGAYRYKSIESILKNSLDLQALESTQYIAPPPAHDNIRGAEYFDRGESAC
jgi:transposase